MSDTQGPAKPGIIERWHYGHWRLLVLCVVAGLFAGLGAIAFHLLLEVSEHYLLGYMAGYQPPPPGGESSMFTPWNFPINRWVLFILPAIGGLVSGVIVYWLAPEAAGHGTDAAIAAYHYRGGRVRGRVPFIKALTSAITIGTGGSAGREGPIAQIGAGLASILGGWLKISPTERRILMAAGMGGGVGAIFSAPLAGALFAAEVLYRDLDLEYEVIIPSVITSSIAYSIFGLWFGWDPIFSTPPFDFQHPGQLLPYTILALVVAAGAILFIKVFYRFHHLFDSLRIRPHFKPAIGGLLTGLVGLMVPEALGTSFGALQSAINIDSQTTLTVGLIGIVPLMALAFGKIFTTSFTVSSGGSGGVFGPSVVIGGALGGTVGISMANLFPRMAIEPGAFVLVGMAAFFAAAANAPISTIIIVSEMSGNYHLLLPSMWVCIIAYLLARRHSLYNQQVRSRFEATTHMGGMLNGILHNITVGQALQERPPRTMQALLPNDSLSTVLNRLTSSDQASFPVMTDGGDIVGLITERDLRAVMNCDPALERMLTASDLAGEAVVVTTSDTLLKCVQEMTRSGKDEVVVIAPEGGKALALMGYADVVAAFHRRMRSTQ